VLISKNHIFNFVNQFVANNQTIQQNQPSFELTALQYNDFIEYMKGKNYEYKTQSDYALEDLQEDAKNEKYYESIKTEFEILKSKMDANKKGDLTRFKPEIKQFIEEEIASRFLFQRGRIEIGLKYDTDVEQAKKLLTDLPKIKSILTQIEKPSKPFNPNKRF
jgi:carboxyl-terminal processing protease